MGNSPISLQIQNHYDIKICHHILIKMSCSLVLNAAKVRFNFTMPKFFINYFFILFLLYHRYKKNGESVMDFP